MEGNLGNAPTLPQGLTRFLLEAMAKEQDDGPFISMPGSSLQSSSRAPMLYHPYRKKLGLKSHPDHLLVDPSSDHDQSWRN